MKNRAKWFIKQDRFFSKEGQELQSWTITTNPEFSGWNTDSGYDGYGLPKELAEWICNHLNTAVFEEPPYIRERGFWVKNEKPS